MRAAGVFCRVPWGHRGRSHAGAVRDREQGFACSEGRDGVHSTPYVIVFPRFAVRSRRGAEGFDPRAAVRKQWQNLRRHAALDDPAMIDDQHQVRPANRA